MLCVLLGGVGIGMVFLPSPHHARGACAGETLALQVGHVWETVAKHDILL
jgi:hypothetical protein